MINRLLAVCLLAGLVAGSFVAVLQHFSSTPLILRAETYETKEHAHLKSEMDAAVTLMTVRQTHPPVMLIHNHGGSGHAAAAAEAWKPEDGLERTAYTTLVTIGTAVAFAFLLIGAMLAMGEKITAHVSLAYAGAAFFALGLAPAAGLAPELPGSSAAALEVRQIWWVGTALASSLGLLLILKPRSRWFVALGFIALLVPHIIGAPHPGVLESKVPAELAARFTGLSIVLQGVLWLAVGYLVGVFWQFFEKRSAA